MGVRGLQTFLHNEVPNGVFSVNIIEEIHHMKRKYPEKPVILVFYLKDVLYNITQSLNSINILSGLPHRKVHDIFDNSFQELADAGAELHFFVEGPYYGEKFENWEQRQSEQYRSMITALDDVDQRIPTEQIIKKIAKGPGVSTAFLDLKNLCQKYGILHVSMTKCIVDIARYGTEHNVFAIVTTNSNLLIFDGDWRYWYCSNIGLTEAKWNTLEYNKSALRTFLGLSQSQMPVLATIAGNEFVSFNDVKIFHKKILTSKKDYYKNHFPDLAAWIRMYMEKHTTSENDENDLRSLTLELFGSNDLDRIQMVRDSLCFYAMKMTSFDIEQELDLLFIYVESAACPSIFHRCLTGRSIKIQLPPYYDLRRTDMMPYFDIELPLLSRQIGIVRKHKNDVNYKQLVQTKLSHSESYRCVLISPEYPKVEIPELIEITFNKNNNYLNNVRFKLLKWMIFGNKFSVQFSIQNIPKGYMVTIVTIMYLMKLKQLSRLEADAILLSTHLIHENDNDLEGVTLPTTIPSSRLLIVSHLYMHVYGLMVKSFIFLGLNDFIDYLQFDGCYFFYWIKVLENKNENDYNLVVDQIKLLKYYLKFVTNDFC